MLEVGLDSRKTSWIKCC